MSEPSDEPDVAVVSTIVGMVEEDTAQRREADGRGPGWRHATFALLTASSSLSSSLHPTALQKVLGVQVVASCSFVTTLHLGLILAAVGGGYLTYRIGAKRAGVVAVNVWTFAAFLLLLVGPLPWVGLIVGLAAGCATGMLLPAQLSMVIAWAPKVKRGFVICLIMSGRDLGSCLSTLLSSPLDIACPWCFGAFWGSLGIIWIFAFSVFAASSPELHKACTSSGETAWIVYHRGAERSDWPSLRPALSFAQLLVLLLRQPATWSLAFSQFACSSFARTEVLELNSELFGGSRWGLAGADVVGAVGCLLAGCWSYLASKRGWLPELWTKTLQVLGSLLCLSLCLSSSNLAVDTRTCIWLWASACILRAQFAALVVHMVYITPELAPILLGLTTAFAAFGSLIIGQGPWGLSKVVESSWLFVIAGSINIFAALLFVKYGSLGVGSRNLEKALTAGLQAEMEAAAESAVEGKSSISTSMGPKSSWAGSSEVDLEASMGPLDSGLGVSRKAVGLWDLGGVEGSLAFDVASDDVRCEVCLVGCPPHCLHNPKGKKRNVVSLEDGLDVVMDLEEQGLRSFVVETDTQGSTRSSSSHSTCVSLD